MSVILSHGTYDEEFAVHVAEGVYDYETSDGFPGWHPAGDRMPLPYGTWIDDAMPGVMAMLASNPDAAQQFFTSGSAYQSSVHNDTITIKVNGQDVEVNSRLAYLLTQRDWSRGLLGMSDDGDALGRALLAATTAYRNPDAPSSYTSASLTSQVIALLGERTRQPDGWEMPQGMRDDIALIVADYTSSMFAAEKQGWYVDMSGPLWKDISADFPGSPVGAKFTEEDMDAILRTLGKNPKETAILGAGWTTAMTAYLSNQVSMDYPDPQDRLDALRGIDDGLLKDQISLSSAVLDKIMNNAFKGNGDDAALQAQKAALTTAILNVVVAGAIPVVSQVTKLKDLSQQILEEAGNQTVDWLAEQGGDHGAEANNQALQKYNQQIDKTAQKMVIRVLFDAGFWDPDTVNLANQGDPTVKFTTPPTNEDGTLNQDCAEYWTWLNSESRMRSTVESAVHSAYSVER